MSPEIVDRATTTVFYVQEKGDYNQTPAIAFKKLIEHLEGKGTYQGFYGMGLDNPHSTESKDCRFDACASINLYNEVELDKSIQKKEIVGGRFALFTHQGPYAELSSVCSKIFQEWLPTSGHTLTGLPLFCEYPNFLNQDGETKVTKIYLPIKG
jgi:AraC family transcriptional regulator